jgi:hypothetical protein
MAVQWYRRDHASAQWTVVPEISGVTKPKLLQGGDISVAGSYLATTTRRSTPRCLRPGAYLVIVYVNGREVGRASGSLRGPQATPRFDREMNIALCTPRDWRRVASVPSVPYSLLAFPAMVAAWTSRDGSQGALLTRLNGQFPLGGVGGRETPRRVAQVAVRAVSLWARAFPAPPRPGPHWTAVALKLGFGADHGVRRDFSYPLRGVAPDRGRGLVQVQAGFNKNDLAVVVAVFGPGAGRRNREPIIASVTSALV